MPSAPQPNPDTPDAATVEEFQRTLDNLETARTFGKGVHQNRLLGLAKRLMDSDAGIETLYEFAPRFDRAGVFTGGDWGSPQSLQPSLVRDTFVSRSANVVVECLSELRFLAIALGDERHEAVSASDARAFLEEVLARNLDYLFPEATELSREPSRVAERIQRLFSFVARKLGTAGIVGALVDECERVLRERPIMVQRVEHMLRTAAAALPLEDEDAGDEWTFDHARYLIDALEGPTRLSRQDATSDAYRKALADLDGESLVAEARAFSDRMDRTGLVSPQHAMLLRYLADADPDLVGAALALDRVGETSLAEHGELVLQIIHHAVLPETARCVYGLSRFLNRGILFFQPMPPGLRRLTVMRIAPDVAERLQAASELANPPDANALLLSGTLSVLGQPRGMDQGHNPTCQAARAISLWSQNDAGYLLELIARAARDDELVMHFEGHEIRSSALSFGLTQELHTELDPVSLLLTPHLDKIYMEMSRLTIGRGEDGHKWVNPEFHGWWVHRSFASVVNPTTGAIHGFDAFVRCFYAAYHPEYNGVRELVYQQPCGVVSTTPNGEFVGWHAVSIERVARDTNGVWRVYFFNPNRDKVQTWGDGIETSTSDNGEWEGESSLPFEQFVMRLYVFHYKRRELGDPDRVPADVVARIRAAVAQSWAANREWLD